VLSTGGCLPCFFSVVVGPLSALLSNGGSLLFRSVVIGALSLLLSNGGILPCFATADFSLRAECGFALEWWLGVLPLGLVAFLVCVVLSNASRLHTMAASLFRHSASHDGGGDLLQPDSSLSAECATA
jgi:hypothetical protein